MTTIIHKNYIGGSRNGTVIPLIDWPDNQDWFLPDWKEFYSRRTSWLPDGSSTSAIYFLDTIDVATERRRERVLPFIVRNIDDDTERKTLLEKMIVHTRNHNKDFIVVVKLIMGDGFTITQAFHRSTKDQHFHDFVEFAKTLQFDEDHDDAKKPIK